MILSDLYTVGKGLIFECGKLWRERSKKMSYPDPRYFGDKGEVSAIYRQAGYEPDLTWGIRP
jgi:hypothetical protein